MVNMKKSLLLLCLFLVFSQIVSATPPVINSLILNSTSGTNTTAEDLTCYVDTTDPDNDTITTNYQWFEDSSRIECDDLPEENTCSPYGFFSFEPTFGATGHYIQPPEPFNLYVKDTGICGIGGNCWNGFKNMTFVMSTGLTPLVTTQNLTNTTNSYYLPPSYGDTRGCVYWNVTFNHPNGSTCNILNTTKIEPYWFNESILPSNMTELDFTYQCLANVTDNNTESVSNYSNNLTIIPQLTDICTSLNNAGQYYQLNNSVNFTTGSCFLISNDSITLDCAGHNITGNGSGIAVQHTNSINATTKNCNIANSLFGAYIVLANQSILYNNTIFNSSNVGIAVGIFPNVTEPNVYGLSILNNTIDGTLFESGFVALATQFASQSTLIEGNRIILGGWNIGTYNTNMTFKNNLFVNAAMGGGGGSTSLTNITDFSIIGNQFINLTNATMYFQNYQFTNFILKDNIFFNATFGGTISGRGLITFSMNITPETSTLINGLIQNNSFNYIDLESIRLDSAINTSIINNTINNSYTFGSFGTGSLTLITPENVEVDGLVIINSQNIGIIVVNGTNMTLENMYMDSSCCTGVPISISGTDNVIFNNLNYTNVDGNHIQLDNVENFTITNSIFTNTSFLIDTINNLMTVFNSTFMNLPESVFDITSVNLFNTTNSLFNGTSNSSNVVFKASYSPINYSNNLLNGTMAYADIFFSDVDIITQDDTLVSSATGSNNYDLVLITNFSNFGGADTTLLIEENDGIIVIDDCSDIPINPGETCLAVVDKALQGTGAGNNYNNSNLINAFNSTFSVINGYTTPLSLNSFVAEKMIITSNNSIIYFTNNIITNTDAEIVLPYSTNYTISYTQIDGFTLPFNVSIQPGFIFLSNQNATINRSGDISLTRGFRDIALLQGLFLGVNTSALPEFSGPSHVTFYNVNCTEFGLYKSNYTTDILELIIPANIVATQLNNVSDCTDSGICTNLVCNNNILEFDVSGFSSFGVGTFFTPLTPEQETDITNGLLFVLSAFGIVAVLIAAMFILSIVTGGSIDILAIGGGIIAIAAGFGILITLLIIILRAFGL